MTSKQRSKKFNQERAKKVLAGTEPKYSDKCDGRTKTCNCTECKYN